MKDKVSLEDLINIITVLRDPKPEEQEEQSNVEVEAQELVEVRRDAENASEKAKEADEKAGEISQELERERQKKAERENAYVTRSLATEFEKTGIDSDVVASLSEFIDYDKLKNEDNEADEEKISVLSELLAGVARRQPPKGSGQRRALNDDGGIAKYLPKN